MLGVESTAGRRKKQAIQLYPYAAVTSDRQQVSSPAGEQRVTK